jgi:hypothetical protein
MTIALGLLLLQLQAAPQPAPLRITIYPLLVRAPIFGASIHLPNTGGGGEGGDQTASTDWSFNAAYMAGVSFEAPRWFAEFNGQWAALSAHQDAPFGSVDSNTYFFLARGGVRVVKRLSATVGVRRVTEKLDVTLTPVVTPTSTATISGSTKPAVWDPLVGVDWRGSKGGRWTFDLAFQGGGFGVGADVDLQADVYADRHFGDHFDLRLGYSWVYFKLTVDNANVGSLDRPLVSTQTLHGPAVGFGIVF